MALLPSGLLVARLLTPLPSPPTLGAAAIAALQPAAAAAPPVPAGSKDPADVLRPNAAGVIDLVGALTAAQNQADQLEPANPFRLRYHPPILGHAVPVAVEAVMLGAAECQASCVLNHQALHVGDSFEGLQIDRIGPEAILLRSARHRLALPVSDRPVVLQLPAL